MIDKTLYLRLNVQNVELNTTLSEKIKSFFSKFYKEVILYKPHNSLVNIQLISMSLHKKAPHSNFKLVNLDKNLQLKDSVEANVSRVLNLEAKYQKHIVEVPFELQDNTHYFLYDNDVVKGYGIKLLKEKLQGDFKNVSFEVISFMEHILAVNASDSNIEILDLDDFYQSGIVCHEDGTRTPYQTNELLLKKLTGIPESRYFEFKKGFETEIKPFLSNFKEAQEVEALVKAMHTWACDNNRKTFVIGVSGGIDSAVCLALLQKMKQTYTTADYTIIPVCAPIFDSKGTTGQDQALSDAQQVIDKLNIYPSTVKAFDGNKVSQAIGSTLRITDKVQQQQVDYWVRPTFFYHLSDSADRGCIVSTTNHSEWQLGWFSQYLDIFNLMPIIHLSKQKVISLAKFLGIPDRVIEQPPVGGLANGKTDEESFGFQYKDLEAYNTNPKLVSVEVKDKIQHMIASSEFKRSRFNLDYVFAIEQLLDGS